MNTSSPCKVRTIFLREFRSYFQSPVAYVFLVVFLLLMGFFTFFFSHFFEAGEANLRGFFFWFPWVYLILVPAVSMRLWSEERRAGTMELLLTLPVTLRQAILGKYLAALAFLAIGIVLTFPVPVTAALLGDPDRGQIIGGYLGALLLAATYLAVGICTSAMTRNQVISFVLSLVLCLLLLIAGYPPVTDIFVQWAPPWLVNGVASVSFMPQYETIQRGVLDLRALLYFASVITVMLFGTHLVLDNRRAA